MRTIPLLILLLAGCSSQPRMSELEDQYFLCTSSGAQGCQLIAQEMDRRHASLTLREQRKRVHCNKSTVKCMSATEFKAFVERLDGW